MPQRLLKEDGNSFSREVECVRNQNSKIDLLGVLIAHCTVSLCLLFFGSARHHREGRGNRPIFALESDSLDWQDVEEVWWFITLLWLYAGIVIRDDHRIESMATYTKADLCDMARGGGYSRDEEISLTRQCNGNFDNSLRRNHKNPQS